MTLYEKSAKILLENLTDDELIQLHSEMDSDSEDGFFSELTKTMQDKHPEFFIVVDGLITDWKK